MNTPRMNLCMHLGLAVAHATSTNPDVLKSCGDHIVKALWELYDLRGLTPIPGEVDDWLRRRIEGTEPRKAGG